MARIGIRLTGAAMTAVFILSAAMTAVADDNISFKKRGDEEKRFVRAVGTVIVKAAHKTGKKIELVEYEYSKPRANRTELKIKMEYRGAVSDKRYIADIAVKIDSTNKDAWEVLNIDYSDNNNIKHNAQKIQDSIKEMNK